MRKKFIAAVGAISLLGGIANMLVTSPAAEAYTEKSSCIVRSDVQICALTTDYALFDPGAQKGSATNALAVADPGLLRVSAGQYIYRSFYTQGDAGQGTGVLVSTPDGETGLPELPPELMVPAPLATNILAGFIQTNGNRQTNCDATPEYTEGGTGEQGTLEDDYCGKVKNESLFVELRDDDENGLGLYVNHLYGEPAGNPGAGVDDWELTLAQIGEGSADRLIRLHFNNNEGCALLLGPQNIGLCNDRPQAFEVLEDMGIIPAGTIPPGTVPPLYNSDGELIDGTGLSLPYQPIPFLPTIPFLILP